MKKKKVQFSKLFTAASAIYAMAVVLLVLIANFALLWTGRPPMTDETVSVVTTFGAITQTLTFGGYVVLQGLRDNSRNKYLGGENEREDDENGIP